MPSEGESHTFYVRREELSLWQRAERFRRERRLTLSALILWALEEFLDRHEGKGK